MTRCDQSERVADADLLDSIIGRLSEEQYDQLGQSLNPRGLNSPSDRPVPGLISHVAGTMPDGTFCVVDVWESEDAVEQFGQKLMPNSLRSV